MRRYPPSGISYSFGPGPMTPAVRAIVYTNVAVFLITLITPGLVIELAGLTPRAVLQSGRIWQLATYLFVHSPNAFTHILFNMLAVWMFGVDLERRWGTVAFARYFFVTGIGAGVSVILVSLFANAGYDSVTIGASGSVYGLLGAWALLFPHRQILFMFIFPLQARVFVLIIGAIAFLSALGASGSTVSNIAHLGGLVIGLLYLKGPRQLRLSLRYQISRWRMERTRRRFNVHRGGRDWDDRVH